MQLGIETINIQFKTKNFVKILVYKNTIGYICFIIICNTNFSNDFSL